MKDLFLGIDIGSTTLKAVLMSAGKKIVATLYERTKPKAAISSLNCSGRCNECASCSLGSLKSIIINFLNKADVKETDIACTVVTGSQIVEDTKKFIDYDFSVSEVSAHVAGAVNFFPDCKAILDVGGQDSKAMIYNENMQMWTSKMSGICAAGTGAFLDSVSVKLAVPVEEFAEKSDYSTDLEFSSVCAVLSATSINKFKNRFPIEQVIAGACSAQARTIMSGVGELFHNYKGDIVFQGGVASNKAVSHYLHEITGNNIVTPEHHNVMGALGCAALAIKYKKLKNGLKEQIPHFDNTKLKSVALRTKHTRREFLSTNKEIPLVWRNLFFPSELLNAMGVKMLTLETYAALHARNRKKVKKSLDNAAYKGFASETCSFLRVLEGIDLPKPAFGVSTSQPCQMGERVFGDLVRNYGIEENFYSLQTPLRRDDKAIDQLASGIEHSVDLLEKAVGKKMDMGRLVEACNYSNQARDFSIKCNDLRLNNAPLIRGSLGVYFAVIFSQLWGKKELVEIQEQFYNDLLERKDKIDGKVSIEDTHRLLWLHLPPFYSSKLLDHIEITCNAPIVFEEVNYIGWEPLDLNNPYKSLAKKLLNQGFLDPKLRVQEIINTAKRGKLNGCVLYNHMFGRCSMSDASFMKHLREELTKAGIPLLVLDGDCMDSTIDPCSTYTKVNAYVEALNSKKHQNIFGQSLDLVQS